MSIESHIVRLMGLKMIRQIPIIRSTRIDTAGMATWILSNLFNLDKIGFKSFPINNTPTKQRTPSGQFKIEIPRSYPDLKLGNIKAIAC